MLKRVGVLALLLSGGAAFLHPTAAVAQEYRGYNSYAPRYYRDDDRFRDRHREHEWREQERREERREDWRERSWRAHEWRERERGENRWYAAPYNPGPRAYYGYGY